MKIGKFLLTYVLLAVAMAAQGQTTTVSGELLDSLTHEGEPFATIRVYKGRKSEKPVAMSVTGQDGAVTSSLSARWGARKSYARYS